MSRNDPYFQFPLCCLAFGDDPVARLQHVVDWCCVNMGKQMGQLMTRNQLQQLAHDMPPEERPNGLNPNSAPHATIAAGMKRLHVRGGNAAQMLRQHETLTVFCDAIQANHGRFPLVRIRADLLWDTIHGEMPYRNFAVLCGVYSVIGAKKYPARITRDRIRAGAMGYKNVAMMTSDVLKQRQDGAQPLTIDQLRHTLDVLETASCFARVQFSPRRVYFSHRMTREEMSKQLVTSKARRDTVVRANRAADRELRARIRRTIKVGTPQRKRLRDPQAHPKAAPPCPHNVPTITESSLIESFLKEPVSIQRAREADACPTTDSSMDAERKRLKHLIEQAQAIGSEEAMRSVAQFQSQLAKLPGEGQEASSLHTG